MGDHYDTAYMEDVYERERGGDGLRAAAAGADDNHSATTALLLAAEVLLPLARDGQARARRLARAPDRRGVPRRLPGRARARAGARRAAPRASPPRRAAIVDVSRVARRGAFVLDMIGAQQRARSRRLPDRARRGRRRSARLALARAPAPTTGRNPARGRRDGRRAHLRRQPSPAPGRRRRAPAGQTYRDGTIPCQRFRAWEVRGRTAGLVGLGAVGRALRWRLEGLGARVISFDPYNTEATHTDLDAMLAECDIVSMHAPVTPETTGMIGRER